MSTREQAIAIIDLMSEEQLQEFVAMFSGYVDDVPNEETRVAIEEIEQGKNLSREFNSVAELIADLNAERQ